MVGKSKINLFKTRRYSAIISSFGTFSSLKSNIARNLGAFWFFLIIFVQGVFILYSQNLLCRSNKNWEFDKEIPPKFCVQYIIPGFSKNSCEDKLYEIQLKQLQNDSSLSQLEWVELQDLFHFLFAENQFGYSLFGNKPISFCYLPTGVPHIATKDEVFKIYRRGDRSYRKGVSAWEKIQSVSFQKSKAYLLIFHEEHHLPVLAIIINKKALSEVFRKNFDVFRENHYSSIDSLIEDLKDKTLFREKLLDHHFLIGILLGYGRGNAAIFAKRENLLARKFKIPLQIEREARANSSMVSDEIRNLNQVLQPTNRVDPFLCPVSTVRFSADFSLVETRLLIEHYALIHKKLIRIFNQTDWLPILLNRIYEDVPLQIQKLKDVPTLSELDKK